MTAPLAPTLLRVIDGLVPELVAFRRDLHAHPEPSLHEHDTAGAGEGGFNPAVLIGNNARMQGVSVGSRDMFEAMCRAIDLHQIQPVVDKVYPFTEVRAAFEAMRGGEHFGKIVLEF